MLPRTFFSLAKPMVNCLLHALFYWGAECISGCGGRAHRTTSACSGKNVSRDAMIGVRVTAIYVGPEARERTALSRIIIAVDLVGDMRAGKSDTRRKDICTCRVCCWQCLDSCSTQLTSEAQDYTIMAVMIKQIYWWWCPLLVVRSTLLLHQPASLCGVSRRKWIKQIASGGPAWSEGCDTALPPREHNRDVLFDVYRVSTTLPWCAELCVEFMGCGVSISMSSGWVSRWTAPMARAVD